MPSDSLSYLVDNQEDVLKPDQPVGASVEVLGKGTEASQMSDTVYVQDNETFKPINRKNIDKILTPAEGPKPEFVQDGESTIGASVVAARLFGSLGFIAQGLIAGFSIFHAMLVILRTPPFFDFPNFVENTHSYALVFHCLYYAALVISLVAIFDKYDIGTNPGRVIWRAVTLQSTGLSAVFWLLALCFSLACLPVETRMDLYKFKNQTDLVDLMETDNSLSTSSLETLRVFIIARSVFASLGWIMVALRPQTNQLQKHLQTSEES